jgi:mercuric ion transport protein
MTASSGVRTRRDRQGGKPAETALSWAAVVAAAGAVFAWAACCVLPMSLALAGLGLGGLSWVAGQRTWITLAALAVIGVGWVVTWRRARMCRVDSACAAPSRLGIGLLGAATVLILLALIWQPIVEPWALALIRRVR